MGLSFNSNISAVKTSNILGRVERDSQDRRARLSSGIAINSSRESAARLSISEGMRAELGGLTQGARNTENALDLLRTAEGGMNEISAMVIRMRELAVQSSSATLNNKNREAIEAEFNQLKGEIDRLVRVASYNDQTVLSNFGNAVNKETSTALTDAAETGVRYVKLTGAPEGTYTFLDGSDDNEITLGNGVITQTVSMGSRTVDGQVAEGNTQSVNFDKLGIQVILSGEGAQDATGAYNDGELNGKTITVDDFGGSFQLGSDAVPADRLDYKIADLQTNGAVLNLANVSLGTMDNARSAITRLKETIGRVSIVRGDVGAVINRLTHTLENTTGSIERISASESTVRDVDYARETAQLARNEIIRQASVATLAKTNISASLAVSLLQ